MGTGAGKWQRAAQTNNPNVPNIYIISWEQHGNTGNNHGFPFQQVYVMNDKQTDQEVDAQLVDALAKWIVYLVVGGMAAFLLVVSVLAFGLLEFTVRVWLAIGQAVTGWFTW